MTNTAEQILRAAAGAFFGTVGFAMLVHIPKRAWFVSGMIAMMSYMVYWGMTYMGVPDPMAVFSGALFGALSGFFSAHRMKIIGTIYLMSAIVPVVPGLGLYHMMAAIGRGQITAGAETGIKAMITIAMIALGIGTGSFADRTVRNLIKKRNHQT